ncbi:MAG: endonuclease III [Endomicrobiales bacterium]|nr:endonuclease III [Endomicrobiales bacterium]
MTNKKVAKILTLLKKEYPNAKTALNFSNPVEMLVATILSAQCTDKRVNIVTEKLFKKYKTINDYAKASQSEFEQDVRSTGFYRNKAKNIIATAKIIVKDFGGKVPSTMFDLLKLPGVARKTANVVLGNSFGIYEGIVVDTHVIRISNRLGFIKSDNVLKIESKLIELIPKKDWFLFSHFMQAHGRAVCKARRPNHIKCVLKNVCPSANL